MSNKCLRHIESKGKNKRINIYLIESTEGEKAFSVHTKRLLDFKTRHIIKTDNLYSVETFSVLANLMDLFISSSEIKNKILLKELSAIEPFTASTNLKNK